MARGYTAQGTAGVSYAANTTKTLVAVMPALGADLDLYEIGVSADGTTGTALALVVELLAISAIGTGTSVTPSQDFGASGSSSGTAAYTHTVEPTIVSGGTIRSWYMTPNQPTVVYQFPLGRETNRGTGVGYAVRVTNPTSGTTVNVRGWVGWVE